MQTTHNTKWLHTSTLINTLTKKFGIKLQSQILKYTNMLSIKNNYIIGIYAYDINDLIQDFQDCNEAGYIK